jgi:hypothetical protein
VATGATQGLHDGGAPQIHVHAGSIDGMVVDAEADTDLLGVDGEVVHRRLGVQTSERGQGVSKLVVTDGRLAVHLLTEIADRDEDTVESCTFHFRDVCPDRPRKWDVHPCLMRSGCSLDDCQDEGRMVVAFS